MRTLTRTLLIVALLLAPAPSLLAQTAGDPSGHWEGSIQVPDRQVTFEVDFARNGQGELSGTITAPVGNRSGFLLRTVAVDGRSVSFSARRDQTYTGVLSADGKSMAGETTLSGYVLPFSLTRIGDARVNRPAALAPVGKDLEGTWNGALAVNGTSMRFVLTVANHPDGTATAHFISRDEGDLQIPVTAITRKASEVILDVQATGASYAGAVNQAGTELIGTLTQGSTSLPLTFQRAATTDGKR